MRLILHAGTHKTGTTSIQQVLLDGRDWLETQGLYVPNSRSSASSGHFQFCGAFSNTNEDNRKKAKKFIGRAKNAARNSQAMILSSERAYRHVFTQRDQVSRDEEFAGLVAPDYWERRDSYLKELAGALSDFDVEVVLYFRDYEYFLTWLHRTIVKRNAWDGDFEAFRDAFGDRFRYGRQLEVFQRHFQTIHVHSYEMAREKGLMAHFFKGIGYSAPPGADAVWLRRAGQPARPKRGESVELGVQRPQLQESKLSRIWRAADRRVGRFFDR